MMCCMWCSADLGQCKSNRAECCQQAAVPIKLAQVPQGLWQPPMCHIAVQLFTGTNSERASLLPAVNTGAAQLTPAA